MSVGRIGARHARAEAVAQKYERTTSRGFVMTLFSIEEASEVKEIACVRKLRARVCQDHPLIAQLPIQQKPPSLNIDSHAGAAP